MLPPRIRRRLEDAGEAYEEARRERENAIVEAGKHGGGMREIGELVGMSHVGVSKLLARLGVRKPLK